MNSNLRWLIFYIAAFFGLLVGSYTFFDAAFEPAPIECMEGAFGEKLQPHIETIWVTEVWLCGRGLHYELIAPEGSVMLNKRTAEYYREKQNAIIQ